MSHKRVPVFLPCTSDEEASCWQFVASTALVILLGIRRSCQTAVQLLLLPPSCSSADVLSFTSISHTPLSLLGDARFLTLLNYLHIFQSPPCFRFSGIPRRRKYPDANVSPFSLPLPFIDSYIYSFFFVIILL